MMALKRAALTGVIAVSSAANAQQPPVEINVYHGKPVNMFRLTENGVPSFRSGRSLYLIREVGDSVCLTVSNANPIMFSYGVEAAIDTSVNQLPAEWAKLGTLLATLTAGGGDVATVSDALTDVPPAVTDFVEIIKRITAEADTIRRLVGNAAAPGTLDPQKGSIADDGLTLARGGFERLPKSEGHLRHDNVATYIDRKLNDALAGVGKHTDAASGDLRALEIVIADIADKLQKAKAGAAKTALEGELRASNQRKEALELNNKRLNTWNFILPILASYAKQELQLGRKVIDSYMKASTEFRDCKIVKSGLNTYTMNIGAKDGVATDSRSVGKDATVTVRVNSRYTRSRLEFFPASFIVRNDDLRTYSIRRDTLVLEEKDAKLVPRIGGMATITLFDGFDELRSVSLSAGIGTNVVGGEDPVKDLMLMGIVSYRDLFRVGLGWGYVPIRRLRDDHNVGAKVEAGKTVADLMENDHTWDFAVMFSVTGIKLGLGN